MGRRAAVVAKDLGKFIDDSAAVYAELERVLVSKQKDYGPNNINLAPGGPLNGLMVRMNDKMQRLTNLIYQDRQPEHESVEDSFIDLANYSVIALMVLRDKWPTE